ncbi:MAG TPA: OB-fold nucleic acid binding domain-containing protein [Bryobacteraceae bacterium]|nr:OB-fold nucleic acid binding domain-containing protein [Bryobacteraceae bacterium]
MKEVFVNALVPNETVTTHFLVIYKEVRQKKTGEPYLTLVLADRTGEIEAKMWDNVAEVMSTFDRDDFVKVKGLAQLYQNKQQFTVHKIRRAEDHEVEAADYFPCSKRDPDEMFAELREIIAGMRNEHLRKLLSAIFADEKLADLYRRAPAAKSIHHACLGGLIEHVLSLCGLCRVIAAHYTDLDVDLLLSAAILHDIGKVEELAYDRSFAYTTAGQLLGHIIIGLQKIDEKIQEISDFPPKLKLLLEHMILSHHGELEYGSPKVPVFAEALVFHHLDNLDSKFEAMRAAIQKDRNPENEFTGWVPALERVLLKKDLFLKTTPVRQPAPEAPQASPEPASLSSFAEKLKAAL